MRSDAAYQPQAVLASPDVLCERGAVTYRLPLWSVVFYVGVGAGVEDTGRHEIQGPAAVAPLVWHYQVVRLWQMSAEDLLALDQPALLALVGQTRLDRLAVVLPAVVARLRQVPDPEACARLLTALLALIPQEEIVTMVEKLLEDDMLFDSPFLRRIREEGREEGLLAARRRSIVEALTWRFATDRNSKRYSCVSALAQRLSRCPPEHPSSP
jgi:hypothetical protein